MSEPEKASEAKKQEAPKKKPFRLMRILLILFLLFAGMQFFQPNKDNQDMDMRHDISHVIHIPDSVYSLLKTACYDCHSNFTHYAWYSDIQPFGWWMNGHIEDGKRHLNFQEFALLQPTEKFGTTALRQADKLDEVMETVKGGIMPLRSYTSLHKEAKLTQAQKTTIINWAAAAREQILRPQ
ncbi:MAG TPA: heme-binding domain-containing protein [Phnomibacter sp.]|nr:heme-binding domain-containing protein [Phnomibacter sp.]